MESADRASGYFTTLSESQPKGNARTAGIYLRAEPEDTSVLEGLNEQRRSELIADRLGHWNGIKSV